MDAENILAQSVVMVKKELMTSVVAYNLTAQFRRCAAKLAGVQPRRLSFKGVWLSFRDHLLLKQPENLSDWQDLYAGALISAGNRKLPNLAFPLQTDPVFMRESQPGEARKGFFEDEEDTAHDRSDY